MASSKPAVPDPIEIAARYVIEKKLGAGAFGTVYNAKDKILGRMVAIKTIRLEGLAAQGADLDEMLKRFKREAPGLGASSSTRTSSPSTTSATPTASATWPWSSSTGWASRR